MEVADIVQLEKEISRNPLFSKNSRRKNYFLAVCQHVLPDIDLKKVDEETPYGGLIGIGDSWLEKLLGGFKLFRLHAVYHDATGYMMSNYDVGPGYTYLVCFPFLPNSCFLGHIEGLIYCLVLKWVFPSAYNLYNL